MRSHALSFFLLPFIFPSLSLPLQSPFVLSLCTHLRSLSPYYQATKTRAAAASTLSYVTGSSDKDLRRRKPSKRRIRTLSSSWRPSFAQLLAWVFSCWGIKRFMRFLCFCGLCGTRFPSRSRLDAYLHLNAPSWMMQLGNFLCGFGEAVAWLCERLAHAKGLRIRLRVYMNTYVHTNRTLIFCTQMQKEILVHR